MSLLLSNDDRIFLSRLFSGKEEFELALEIFNIEADSQGEIEYSLEQINENLKMNRVSLSILNQDIIEKINTSQNFDFFIEKKPLTNFYILKKVNKKKSTKIKPVQVDTNDFIKSPEKDEANKKELETKVELLYNKVLEHEDKIKKLEYEISFLRTFINSHDKNIGT